jgi:ParB family chromosome partitioning protein
MKTIAIRVEDVQVGERHRALSDDAVGRLAASLQDNGLRQPISVRVVDEMIVDGDITAGVPVLVAGAHRLAAAKSLGWSHIDCIEVDDDAIKAEMWEIAENLHRLDLTKEQRDQHIRRYIELVEAKRDAELAIVVQSGQQLSRTVGRPKSVITEVAEATGLSRQTIERARAPKAPAEVIPISARSEQDAVLAQVNAIISAWNRACPEARAIAMDQLEGGPVFDRSASAR